MLLSDWGWEVADQQLLQAHSLLLCLGYELLSFLCFTKPKIVFWNNVLKSSEVSPGQNALLMFILTIPTFSFSLYCSHSCLGSKRARCRFSLNSLKWTNSLTLCCFVSHSMSGYRVWKNEQAVLSLLPFPPFQASPLPQLINFPL